ncbi:formin-binding protein 1-like [Protopterus annectens]|uniref:formin-binding protein 1-like n=1 Tax=Protopterus annectens TaxID=7888 RepID=UPI001CF9925B|nr:formin-binding protein 1-like [Protopterus annectens]
MDNSKKKFERECREAEKAQQNYEKLDNEVAATKADVEKAKQQLHLRTHMADESKNEYAAQLQNFNTEQQRHFYMAMPQIFKDSQIVVEAFKSGFEPPGDFPFEDFSQHIYRTVSEGAISNTPKQDIGGKIDPKLTVSKAKGKLWLFGKKPKWSLKPGPAMEDFSHLPPEQRRKRLQQRIEELSKELQKQSDQRDALNKMKDVYEKNPQMGDPGSLQPKIRETSSNMERLQMEIHKNEAWLSEVERKLSSRRHSSEVNHLGRESPEGSYTEDTNQEHRSQQPVLEPHSDFYDDFEDDDPLPAIGHCKAVYPFDGQNEGTLAMKEGEVLYILEEDKGDGWTRARNQSGEEGYVPTSYVDITLEKNSKGS